MAIEERVEAKLALGRHDEVTGELDALVAEFPYRERLWGQLMLALYRSGRQADALRAYSQVRTLLARGAGDRSGRVAAEPRRGDPVAEAGARLGPQLDGVRSRPAAGLVTAWRPALPMALARDDAARRPARRDGLARRPARPRRAAGRSERWCAASVARDARRWWSSSDGARFEQGCAVLYGATSTSRLSRLQPLLDAVTVVESLARLFDDDVERFAAELRDVVGKVGRSTGKPVVLIVDDVDRAEPETVEVLERLIASPEPGGLLVIATTAAASASRRRCPTGGGRRSARWRPFSEREVAALLELRLGRPPSPELAAAVREETGREPAPRRRARRAAGRGRARPASRARRRARRGGAARPANGARRDRDQRR